MFRTLIIVVVVGMASAHAATVGVKETWSAGTVQDWQLFDHSGSAPLPTFFGVVDGALGLEPVPDPGAAADPRWSFIADAAASGGIFTGSLYDVGAHTLAFDVHASVAANLTIELINEMELIVYQATIQLVPGDTKVAMPIDPDHFHPDIFTFPDSFEPLLRDTERLWITLAWDKAAPAAAFQIDNVELLGAGPGYGAWIDSFGLPFEQRLAGADADGDGDGNAAEFIVDSLPNDPSNRFSFACNGGGLEWSSSSNCQYTVWRSTNLVAQAFEPVGTVKGTGGAVGFEDPEDPPCAYYKLEVGRK